MSQDHDQEKKDSSPTEDTFPVSLVEKLKGLAATLPWPIPSLVSFLENFGANGLVGVVAGLVLAAILTWFGYWIPLPERVRGKGVWDLQAKKIYIVYSAKARVTASLHGKTAVKEEEREQSVKLSDVVESSLLIAQALPSNALQRVVPKAGGLDPTEWIGSDVIVIGGPIATLAYAQVYGKLRNENREPPFDFFSGVYECLDQIQQEVPETPACAKPRAIVQKTGTDRPSFETTYGETSDKSDPKGKVEEDFGLFIVGPNPFDPSRRFILIAGSHKVGTQGVTRFLTSPEGSRETGPHIKNALLTSRYVSGIVKTDSSTWSSRLAVPLIVF